ncbi:MAG: hypothetical protein E7356_01930 [Clostridiales bacterium]|nr:hypothetical protein [Clostridiales bacterium]
MSYKKMKFNYVVNMEKIIGEIDDIELPPPYDDAFKQLIFENTQAREEFLKLADFVNKNFSIEKQRIHIAGVGAISLATFLTLCSTATETQDYLYASLSAPTAACLSIMMIKIINEIKCFLKNDSLLSLTYATLKKDTQPTNFDIINNTKLDDTDYICAKTIIYNAFDKQLIEMLENINDKEREM